MPCGPWASATLTNALTRGVSMYSVSMQSRDRISVYHSGISEFLPRDSSLDSSSTHYPSVVLSVVYYICFYCQKRAVCLAFQRRVNALGSTVSVLQ